MCWYSVTMRQNDLTCFSYWKGDNQTELTCFSYYVCDNDTEKDITNMVVLLRVWQCGTTQNWCACLVCDNDIELKGSNRYACFTESMTVRQNSKLMCLSYRECDNETELKGSASTSLMKSIIGQTGSKKRWGNVRDYSVYGLSQWETSLHCNIFSHWLTPFTEWSLNVCLTLTRFIAIQIKMLITLEGMNSKHFLNETSWVIRGFSW